MKNYYHFNKIDSTSSYLKENYKKYDNLTFVSASCQEKGHGRYNREWFSGNGENLLFSILIKEKSIINKYASLSLASAACIYQILSELNIKNVSIKWPNDVFVNNKKIAGILLESVSLNNEMEALVLGVGINVNVKIFTKELTSVSTSIFLELGKEILIEDFKEKVYLKFTNMINDIKNNDKKYLNVIKNNNYLKGKKVYAEIKGQKTLVEVMDINEDNSLNVKRNNEYIDLYSGEISFHV